MNNNKVQNPKQDALPNANTFNDEDILEDVSMSLKHLLTMYGTLGQEASNKTFADQIETLSKSISTMARDAFNLMFEKGWYTLERQTPEKLTEEYNKFSQKAAEISA